MKRISSSIRQCWSPFVALTLLWLFVLTAPALVSCGSSQKSQKMVRLVPATPLQSPALIPQPQKVSYAEGFFSPTGPLVVALPAGWKESDLYVAKLTNLLKTYEAPLTFINGVSNKGNVSLLLSPDKLAPEAYTLAISRDKITIEGGSRAAVGYAIATLQQLYDTSARRMPCGLIVDEPRFRHRGFMLDVSRHFMSKALVFQVLDEMQRYKMNRFHWHLTDAGGWRIELKSFPELTRKTAYRTEIDWRKWWEKGDDRRYLDEGTPGAYGGYYTQEDIKEVLAYAAERDIMVIPEFEMPGHSEEVLHAFPELSCSGKALKGESDFCVGNPKTLPFIKRVLDEFMEIFPAPYIHIGGDEAGKSAWRTCPKCQAFMKKEGIKDVDGLQSRLIHDVDEYITSKGRRMVGFDEIMEGGLSPNATVMSWRGTAGGRKAALGGHDVIMSPNGYFYLDYYQADPRTEPFGMYGYLPMRKVYSFLSPENKEDQLYTNPSEKEMIDKHLLGVQAHLWTEFINDEARAAYMIFPRLLAVAEIGWSPSEGRTWAQFKPRVNRHVPLLKARGVNTFELSGDLMQTVEVDKEARTIAVSLESELYPVDIRYRTDGIAPGPNDKRYVEGEKIILRDTATLIAQVFRNGAPYGSPSIYKANYHKGLNATMKWHTRIGAKYPAGGINTALIDGIRGGISYMDKKWLGNEEAKENYFTVYFKEPTQINRICMTFMQSTPPGIYMPSLVKYVAETADGKKVELATMKNKTAPTVESIAFEDFAVDTDIKAVAIHVYITKQNGFFFTDEIVIN